MSEGRGLRGWLRAVGRRLLGGVRRRRSEVEYGQTLTRGRRKRCVLKSVRSVGCAGDGSGAQQESPYCINFEFSREEGNLRSSVANFQKIDMGESCCERCVRKGEAFSVSSDSACDVSSESSCDDEECRYRRAAPEAVRRREERSVERFVRMQRENFRRAVEGEEGWGWVAEEPRYESVVGRGGQGGEEAGYDVPVTRGSCSVVEPSYENLKEVQTYAEPRAVGPPRKGAGGEGEERGLGSRTYDEVIESLKLWQLSLRRPECSYCSEKADNDINRYVEGYESLENDFNNDIEEFCC